MASAPRAALRRCTPVASSGAVVTAGDRKASSMDQLIVEMRRRLAVLVDANDVGRFFLATYLRTTEAVAAEIDRGAFRDNAWVEQWDVAFARYYLDARDNWDAQRSAPGPWDAAFAAADGPRLPPLRHVLLGMNAHINFDLPQALLAVISDEEFADRDLTTARAADHAHIDDVLAARTSKEDRELLAAEQPGDRTLLDRVLTPFNRAGTRRFLREARRKVWHNARLLSDARRGGQLEARLDELAALSRTRVSELRTTRQVLLVLATKGFGVQLLPSIAGPPPTTMEA